MRRVTREVAAACALAAIVACAGDGTGLDEFGRRLAEPGPAPAPTLSAIQRGVFTPICTRCHTGASAPLGLALDAGLARGNLVAVPSVGVPGVLRVDPGKPDSSYLMWKLEGRSGVVGARMPLGLLPLSGDWIAAIRGWIADDARDN